MTNDTLSGIWGHRILCADLPNTNIRKFGKSLVVTVAGLVLLGAGVISAQATKPAPNHRVTLCHRTGSVAGGNAHNGYSIITVDIASVANAKGVRGHDSHNQVGNGPEGDIIPSYTYKTFTYPGKNLANGGAEFLANGCKAVIVPPTTTTTPPETTTTTPPETTTTTPEVSGTSATTSPETTTTTTPEVLGTSATTTSATTPVTVLGTSATANPLPAGASAGQGDTSGQLVADGLTGLAALIALGAGFVLRRRHGVI